jgi:hypothetical protein
MIGFKPAPTFGKIDHQNTYSNCHHRGPEDVQFIAVYGR